MEFVEFSLKNYWEFNSNFSNLCRFTCVKKFSKELKKAFRKFVSGVYKLPGDLVVEHDGGGGRLVCKMGGVDKGITVAGGGLLEPGGAT